MPKFSPKIVFACAMIGLSWAAGPEAGASFAPVAVTESIDNNGGSLTFNSTTFNGLIRNVVPGQPTSPVEDRAVVAFNLAGLTNATSATLSFTLSGNNYGGDQIRTFTESLFLSSGAMALSDFGATATLAGTQTFDIFTSPQTFSVTLTGLQIAAALGTGGQYLGVRFAATDPNSFPSVVYGVTLNVNAATAAVPEPASIALVMLGLGGAAAAAGRSRRRAG